MTQETTVSQRVNNVMVEARDDMEQIAAYGGNSTAMAAVAVIRALAAGLTAEHVREIEEWARARRPWRGEIASCPMPPGGWHLVTVAVRGDGSVSMRAEPCEGPGDPAV